MYFFNLSVGDLRFFDERGLLTKDNLGVLDQKVSEFIVR